jgi:ATP-dependent DNA helicase DinG
LSKHISFDTTEFIKNFPFLNIRDNQSYVLNEISEALHSDYRYILLEAPTGSGKSAVGIAVALTLGSSYICTSTKDLQDQYKRDFPFARIAKGMNNFSCLIKEDFIKNGIYTCGACSSSSYMRKRTNAYCSHTKVDYGPCLTRNSEIARNGCIYKPAVSEYEVIDRGTKNEQVVLNSQTKEIYQDEHFKWLQAKNLAESRKEWTPCGYYDQLNVARNASHSIFNYAMFLSLLPSKKIISPRELLILDEGHSLEIEMLKFTSYTVSRNKWRKYLPGFSIINSYDIEMWINFLIQLEAKMLALLGDAQKIKELFIQRKKEYNWNSINVIKIKRIANTKMTDFFAANGSEENLDDSTTGNNNDTNNEIEELEVTIAQYLTKQIGSEDLANQAIFDTDRLTQTIDAILSNPKNWIISNIKKEYDELTEVILKPLDISPYCKDVFDKCSNTLVMSATILNPEAFCRNVGLNVNDVKFIQIQSDFPIENRLIYPLNIAYLNYQNLQLQKTKSSIARAVDNIMTQHRKRKGIIHTTSYEQLNFIKENISKDNSQRLLVTDPDLQREDVIAGHINSIKPTVLISPSLYTGIDLKDDLSRFQIITKIPYPNLHDRWINAKRDLDEQWYSWQTALRLVQAYGRSIRSKEDWARTYVLDSAFGSFVNKNRNLFPDWFRQAIRSPVSS